VKGAGRACGVTRLRLRLDMCLRMRARERESEVQSGCESAVRAGVESGDGARRGARAEAGRRGRRTAYQEERSQSVHKKFGGRRGSRRENGNLKENAAGALAHKSSRPPLPDARPPLECTPRAGAGSDATVCSPRWMVRSQSASSAKRIQKRKWALILEMRSDDRPRWNPRPFRGTESNTVLRRSHGHATCTSPCSPHARGTTPPAGAHPRQLPERGCRKAPAIAPGANPPNFKGRLR
jgi:hypothetical protein